MTSIGENPFSGCAILTNIEVAKDNIRYFNEQYRNLKKYEELHETFKNDILSSDEKVINYFRALMKNYEEFISLNITKRQYDIFFYVGSLNEAKYINMEQLKELGRCLLFSDGHMTREFEEFNRFFIRKYGNGA